MEDFELIVLILKNPFKNLALIVIKYLKTEFDVLNYYFYEFSLLNYINSNVMNVQCMYSYDTIILSKAILSQLFEVIF
jgi:hypothetical protein